MLFSDVSSLKRILIVGTLAYLCILLILRNSGKRTLSKMNAYDFIVTVALGSILSSLLTNPDLKLVDGLVGFTILIFLQYILSWLASHFKKVDQLIKSEPTLLYYKGTYYEERMKAERIPKSLILQAVRSKGYAHLDNLEAVVLETDGTYSIIEKPSTDGTESSLQNVPK